VDPGDVATGTVFAGVADGGGVVTGVHDTQSARMAVTAATLT
jgi:hypothetical protein